MNQFIHNIISEAFKSKKQQRYFYAQAGNKDLPTKERNKFKKMAKEFSDKTDFKKIPEVAEEELDEIVDEIGNIRRSKKPSDLNTKGITQSQTTDQIVKTAAGSMGIHGVHGTHTSLRYWAESDQSKTLGFNKTMKQDVDYDEAEDYFKDELEMDDAEAEERLKAIGYDKDLPGDKVRLVEDPKTFMKEYIDSIMAKRSSENDLLNKENEISEINPILMKQIKSLKNSINSNEISVENIIKLLRNNE